MELGLFALASNFFLIANPVGNIPTVVALVKDFPFERQRTIVLREAIFALMVAVGFQFIGRELLNYLQIKTYAVSIAGGLLLFFVAIRMIFPSQGPKEISALKREPFLVPLATPTISGGGLMSSIMIYSGLTENPLLVTSALLVAWCAVIPVMFLSIYLKKILGKQGLLALEQLMGMVLVLLSMKLLVQGFRIFLTGQ